MLPCKNCKKEKPLTEFFKQDRNRSGFQTFCKKCCVEQRHARTRTLGGVRTMLYRRIVDRVKCNPYYTHRKLCFSEQEFRKFLKSNRATLLSLYKGWVKSGFKKKFAPSLDRIDGNEDYTLDNIQLITTSENVSKSNRVRIRIKKLT